MQPTSAYTTKSIKWFIVDTLDSFNCQSIFTMHRIHDFIDSHHSFLCCSPYYLIIQNRVLISNFDLLKHLQKQVIFLLTITSYVAHTGAEINHISNKAQVYYKHSNTYTRCRIDSGTCYQVNRMSTQTWHVVGWVKRILVVCNERLPSKWIEFIFREVKHLSVPAKLINSCCMSQNIVKHCQLVPLKAACPIKNVCFCIV